MFDVILIGAGISSLVCGTFLQEKGYKTLILEQHEKAGGSCTVFQREGYTFDVAVHMMHSCGPQNIVGEMLGRLGIDQEFISFAPLEQVMYKDYNLIVPPEMEEYKILLQQLFPGEATGLDELFQAMERIYVQSIASFKQDSDPINFPRKYPDIFASMNLSYKEFLGKYIQDTDLMTLLSSNVISMGLPSSRGQALKWSQLLNVAHFEGLYYPVGGTQVFADKLLHRYCQLGGEIRYQVQVKEIIADEGRVYGVRLADDQDILASTVISAAGVKQTYLDLLKLPDKYKLLKSQVARFEDSYSTVVLYLGVKKFDLSFVKAPILWWLPEIDIDEYFHQLEDNVVPEQLLLAIVNPTRKWPALAPEGREIIIIETLVKKSLFDDWQSGRHEIKDQMLKQVETILPGLNDRIEVIEVAAPPTLEKYLVAHNGGRYGIASTVNQSYLKRPKIKGALQGLFLTGNDVITGAGVASVAIAGELTAEEVIKFLRGENHSD